MSSLYNSSSDIHTSTRHSPLLRSFAVEHESVLLLQISVVVGVFHAVGHLCKSPRVSRSTILLLVATLILNPQSVSQIIRFASFKAVGVYLIPTVLLQIGLATKFTVPKQEDQSNLAQLNHRLKPKLFPCRTTHTRLFPTKHSFSYSYLLVGVPVDWQGTAGTLLSAGESFGHKTWFSVNADDYLARGSHENGLQGKLEDFLSSQDIPVDLYTCAYLVTAPRFLGFSFNPVSFWYLYDRVGQLSAMILEVNNTFDERRMYFMERDTSEPTTSTKPFSTAWPKDFHVSPFNDRDGGYTLTAKDVEPASSTSMVDNNIVLLSDEGKAKVVARIYSTENGSDPNDMSRSLVLSFLRQWWWVGFMTNLRILREARLLWVKGLEVFYRPEVLKSSIGRNESSEERTVEPYFRAFLAELVKNRQQSEEFTVISYRPAAGPDRGKTINIPDSGSFAHQAPDSLHRTIDVHILTPAFYSEFVSSTSASQAFLKYCFEPDKNEAMVHVSTAHAFQTLLSDSKPAEAKSSRSLFSRRELCLFYARKENSLLNLLCGLFVISLRGRFYSNNNNDNELHPTEFDRFVLGSHSRTEYQAYVRVALRVLLAKRLAFGFGGLLSLYQHLLNLIAIWRVSSAATRPFSKDTSVGMVLSLVTHIVIYHVIRMFLFL